MAEILQEVFPLIQSSSHYMEESCMRWENAGWIFNKVLFAPHGYFVGVFEVLDGTRELKHSRKIFAPQSAPETLEKSGVPGTG